ncbi:MAG: chromosomal replication initiator protein DnaA [Spirochaetia bacterium]
MSSDSWDYHIFWKEALKQLRSELSEQEFVMWFENLTYYDAKEQEIILAVPSSFYRDQVKQRYLKKINEILSDLSGKAFDISFVVDKEAFSTKQKELSRQKENSATAAPAVSSSESGADGSKDPKHTSGDTPVESDKKPGGRKPSIPSPSSQKSHKDLKEDYNFDNFVVGDNNVLAANACIAIAKNPGTAFNPCLIYGGVGLGKTHLIQSIGNYIYSEFEDARVVYVTAETFTNEFIDAIRNNKNYQFKNRYRKVDVLLIDDIHFLQNKDQTQEELFHTFNALYDSNKQMVFTCDRPVSELKNLTDRLRSRFERGLNVDLQPPNYETRYAILKSKIEKQNIKIDEEVIELISRNITSHVRDLEAALTKLIAYSNLLDKRITLSIAKEQLRDVFTSPKQNNINSEIIQRVVAEYFGLSPNDLRGKKRTKAIALPRQIAMFITREITELSTTEVGYEFGGRDHTTVMHAYQRVESRKQMDPTLENTISKLVRQIREYGTKS